MKMHRWIVIVILVLALSGQTMPVSAAPLTIIRLTSPTPNPSLIGDDINFALVIDATDIPSGVAGVDIYLTYDPLFVVPSPSPLGVVEPLPDFFGPSNITWYEALPKGQCPPPIGGALPCIHLVAAGPGQVTHSGAVARFHFQAIATTAGASFAVLATPKMVVDANGFLVDPPPTLPPALSVKIVNRILTGKVSRQGVPASPNPGGGTLACAQVILTNQQAVIFGPVFTDSSGGFTLTNPPSGVQTLRANYPGYLGSAKQLTISTGGPSSINVGATTLRGGDVNGDNKINILDVGTIISRFNQPAGVGSADAGACGSDDGVDINDDGKIDISDLGILTGANWGLTGPTPWQP